MPISHTRIWTPVLMSRKIDGISTLFHIIPEHPEWNHQAMANSHTVHWVLGFLMTPMRTRQNTVWAGELRWMWELHSNFKSLQCRDSIHSMTGVFRWCGCFQMCLKIQRMILWWKSMAPRHYILQWKVWCMLFGLKMNMFNRMWHTGWSKLQRPGQ